MAGNLWIYTLTIAIVGVLFLALLTYILMILSRALNEIVRQIHSIDQNIYRLNATISDLSDEIAASRRESQERKSNSIEDDYE